MLHTGCITDIHKMISSQYWFQHKYHSHYHTMWSIWIRLFTVSACIRLCGQHIHWVTAIFQVYDGRKFNAPFNNKIIYVVLMEIKGGIYCDRHLTIMCGGQEVIVPPDFFLSSPINFITHVLLFWHGLKSHTHSDYPVIIYTSHRMIAPIWRYNNSASMHDCQNGCHIHSATMGNKRPGSPF